MRRVGAVAVAAAAVVLVLGLRQSVRAMFVWEDLATMTRARRDAMRSATGVRDA